MIDVAGSDAGNFDSVAVAGLATLDGPIQINTGTFVPGTNDPDLPFFVTPTVTGQFTTIDSDDYSVVETDSGLALRVAITELAGAQAVIFEPAVQGQVVAENLQLAVISTETHTDDLDEVFASELELDFVN